MAKLTLETITPLHIGSGNRYSGAEFVLEDNTLHRVSLDRLLRSLSADQIEALTDRLEGLMRIGFM